MADSIIVFDGVCVLCSRWVDFVLRHDRHRLIARHRYRMFGRRAACRIPTADIADRFLR
jgi:predicted DCC family thiol-disulfide oxidoreductase YuxK